MRLLLIVLLSLRAFAQSPVPELPADIPPDATMYTALMSGNVAGQQAVWKTPDGINHAFFQFNDRGRGPKQYVTYRLNPDGTLASLEITGNDYMKNPVDERFSIANGKAKWKSAAEDGSADANGRFFASLNGAPEGLGTLARAILAHGNKLGLLPAGEATIEKLQDATLNGDWGSVKASLYAISGLDLTPTFVWLDDKQEYFAQGETWFMVIRKGFEKAAPELVKAQQAVEKARLAKLNQEAVTRPQGDLVIRNANVFDPESGKLLARQTVVVRGNNIVSVGKDSASAKNGTIIDGTGKTLIPGMWDMHQHFSSVDPLLDIAAGVTTGRDLANDIDQLTDLRKRIDSGEQIGPRIIAAGFIDGPGPFQGPTKILADNEKQARDYVAMYNKLGYPQIKIYSSLKPEIVPAIYDEAHKRGMRVSGHIPAGMTVSECVKLGQDEVKHMNFVFLNFMPDVKETRTPARFIEPGKRAAGIDLKSKEVQDFIALLKAHHTVIDPTMSAWENTYTDRPGQMSRNFAAIAERLPAQLQRGLKAAGQALPVTAETDQLYKDSYKKFGAMLKLLHDSGITIVPGTVNFAGFAYQRELEIYVESGIPASDVLRMATIGSAKVMSKDKELGSITPGKLADMVLIDGDPTKNISDIRKVKLVIKDGKLYDPAKIDAFMGIKPWDAAK